jgi:hypothetical protein
MAEIGVDGGEISKRLRFLRDAGAKGKKRLSQRKYLYPKNYHLWMHRSNQECLQ